MLSLEEIEHLQAEAKALQVLVRADRQGRVTRMTRDRPDAAQCPNDRTPGSQSSRRQNQQKSMCPDIVNPK